MLRKSGSYPVCPQIVLFAGRNINQFDLSSSRELITELHLNFRERQRREKHRREGRESEKTREEKRRRSILCVMEGQLTTHDK